MSFDDLVLHPRSKNLVTKISAYLPHGLIVEGPTGTGVVTVAKALAKNVGAQVFIIEPKKKVKGEYVADTKEGSIIIDDIRRLYEQTRTKQPDRQVYIIDTGEKSMSLAAQNAFLKLLEEPRDGVHFIIATHQPDLLLPTVISRTQRLPLLLITAAQTSELINSLAIEDPTKHARLAFVGRGRPALIHRLATDKALYDARVAIMSDAKTLLGTDAYQKLKTIHTYRDNRADALTLLDDMNHQIQTVLKSQPNQRLVKSIEKNLQTRQRIAAGGNIRLQLATSVL